MWLLVVAMDETKLLKLEIYRAIFSISVCV